MSDIKDRLIEVKLVSQDDDGITLTCVIQKEIFFKLFSSYEFNRTVESSIAHKLVDELPVSIMNELMGKISLDSVAKLATVEMAKMASGSKR